MLGRWLCALGWHRMGKPHVVSQWGGAAHRGAETLESRCRRECGHVIHFIVFPLFTAEPTENHQ